MLKKYTSRITLGLAIFGLVFATIAPPVSAAPITGRTVTIGNSAANASTTYGFTFTAPSATVVRSASMTACTTAAGTCTTPSGFSVASSTLTSQPTNLGDASGWTVSTATPGSLRLSKAANVATPTGAQAVSFSNVVNPSTTNATFFMRITTYSDGTWTTPIDTGTVATSTAGQTLVTANVDEALTFTLGATTVALGSLTTSSTGSGSSTMVASTNAATGYTITTNGTTLASGANTITALGAPTASAVNTKQFGINLMSNSTPSIGAGVSGAGTGTAATGYNAANSYKFVTGDSVATATGPTNSNTYTVSYMANVDGITAAGQYSTTLTYIATPNF